LISHRFTEEAYNELPYACQVAQRLATDYHEMLVTANVAAHVSGRRNHAHRLWALMLFAQWYGLMIERAYKMAPPPFPDYEPMPIHGHVSPDHWRR
jgi:hypothetical protein